MQKARETKKRKAEIKRKYAQRVQAKKSFQNIKVGEKRSVNNNNVNKPKKRERNIRSHIRNSQSITELSK